MTRDRCTAAPDFDFGETCCAAHDRAYSAGRNRADADRDLMICIAQSGRPGRAALYWMGVRAFGWLRYRRRARQRRKLQMDALA